MTGNCSTIVFGDRGGSSADFAKQVNDVQTYGNGKSFKINITAYDKAGTTAKASNSLVFINNASDTSPITALSITYTDPTYVEVGAPTLDTKLSSSVKATVVSQSGAAVPFTSNPGNYYRTQDSAKAQNGIAYNAATFTKKGAVFYQPVTLTFAKNSKIDLNSIFNNMTKDGTGSIQINGQNINASNIDAKANTITFVREISVGNKPEKQTEKNVSKEPKPSDKLAEPYSIVQAKGVVTVGDNTAELRDDQDNVVSRGLAPKSGWATDKYRINNKTNEIEYHVSTHEWLSSKFITKTQVEANDIATTFKNVTELKGSNAVNLGGPKGYVYSLFKSDGTKASRGLSGLTSWFTDKSATDDQGNTYYRVSTNEWIKLDSGVKLN